MENVDVAPDMTFRITIGKQENVQVRDLLWIWNPWGRTHKVPKQEQSVAAQKWALVQQFFLKKNKTNNLMSLQLGLTFRRSQTGSQ